MHDLSHREKKTKLNERPTKWMMNKEEKAFLEGKSVQKIITSIPFVSSLENWLVSAWFV